MKWPIVVGTDLTEASDEALLQAEALATRDGVALTVAHAVSPLLWGSVSEGDYIDRLRERIRQRVTLLTGRPEDEYDVLIARGLAHAVLARFAALQQALLVVGHQSCHGIGHALRKNISERVVERARGPVLVARPWNASDRILVAVDRPFDRSRALEVAVYEAWDSGSELALIHCIDTGFIRTLAADVINGGAYAARPLGLRSAIGEARRALQAELRRRHASAELYVVEGNVQDTIAEYAARGEAGLVVVGTAHRPAPTSPVTTAVLRHAPCSVLVVDDDSSFVARGELLHTGPS